MRRKAIAFYIYRSGLAEIIIISYSYRFSLTGIVIASFIYCSKVTKSFSLNIIVLLSNFTLITKHRLFSSGVNLTHACERGIWGTWSLQHYGETPCYIFALSHNALTLWRKVIAFYIYRSRLLEIVTASDSYRSVLIGNVIALYSSHWEHKKNQERYVLK